MGTSFWDSILVYVLGDSMSRLFDFCERGERPFFRIFGSLLYSSSHLFRMWLISMLWCRLTITHFSISLYSSIFILFLHFTLPHLISFSSHHMMFELGSASTLYSCLFDVSIPLSSLFVWRSLGLRLMTFSTHCISCMRGREIISLGYLSLVSFRFFHPITLAYVTSRVWRPPWGHDFTHCAWQLTHGQYLRLVRDYFVKHDGWGAMIWFKLGHTLLISGGFSEVMSSTLGHTSLIDDCFFRDDVLHWGIASSPLHLGYDGLGVVEWPYTGA